MSLTSRDVAREVGVSQSTVSRALRGDPRVAPETLARVIETAQRMNYLPNSAARSLITKRANTIGVVVSDITNPLDPLLVDVLHDELFLAGYRTVLLNERTEGRGADDVLPQIQGRSVDGIVFASATLDSPVVDDFAARGIPLVLLNRDIDGVDVDRVVSENLEGGRIAARTLVTLGHRRIAVIAGPSNTSTSRDREAGFRAVLEAQGIEFDEGLRRSGDYSHQSGYQWCLELLRLEDRPTAIFCGNDVIAFGALDASHRIGLRVPEDLSIIGYDDIAMSAWEIIRLTTVSQPLTQMAKSAARMLITRLEGNENIEARRRVFPASLVRRETTGPPPV
jgi:LacI family transcriptional regulator, galactose operon repressor